MECRDLVRSAGAARIPIQFVADSTSSSHNKQVDGHEPPHQPRYRQQQQQQQQRQSSATSARDKLASSSINGRLAGTPPPSRHMANSVETLFRDGDSGLRSRTETTTTVRPLTVAAGRLERDRRPRQRAARPADGETMRGRTASESGRASSSGDSRRSQVALGAGTGTGYSSGDDSADDAASDVVSRSRSTSTHLPDSSTPRTFRVAFDVEGYDVDDIGVRVSAGRRLVVHGVRRQTDGGRTSTTEFCRKIRLPDDVDPARLDCYLQPDGRVVVEAPRQRRTVPPVGDEVQATGESPLNVPLVTGDDRRQLGLLVEVGRLFRADDVVVKVKNSALTLTVAADRTEHPDGADAGGRSGRLKASVTWEFDLPGTVDVETLRAGLTVDGLLRITARLSSPLPPPPSVANSTM